MKTHYRTQNGRLTFELAAETQKALFKQIAATQEVFEAETQCGCCGSAEIKFRVRSVESNEFFELHCLACTARFEFGQHKTGGSLFPKRRSEDNAPLPDRGWVVWEGTSNGHRQGTAKANSHPDRTVAPRTTGPRTSAPAARNQRPPAGQYR